MKWITIDYYTAISFLKRVDPTDTDGFCAPILNLLARTGRAA